jgi:hypothetical protein
MRQVKAKNDESAGGCANPQTVGRYFRVRRRSSSVLVEDRAVFCFFYVGGVRAECQIVVAADDTASTHSNATIAS